MVLSLSTLACLYELFFIANTFHPIQLTFLPPQPQPSQSLFQLMYYYCQPDSNLKSSKRKVCFNSQSLWPPPPTSPPPPPPPLNPSIYLQPYPDLIGKLKGIFESANWLVSLGKLFGMGNKVHVSKNKILTINVAFW